jgi:hypothetical protein
VEIIDGLERTTRSDRFTQRLLGVGGGHAENIVR